MQVLAYIFNPPIFLILMIGLVVIFLGSVFIFIVREDIKIWIRYKLKNIEFEFTKRGPWGKFESNEPLLEQVKAENEELESKLSNTDEARAANAAGLVAGLHVANLWRLFYLKEALPISQTGATIAILKEIRKESELAEQNLIERGVVIFRKREPYFSEQTEQKQFLIIHQLVDTLEKQELIERSQDDKLILTILGDEFIEFIEKDRLPKQREEYKDMVQ